MKTEQVTLYFKQGASDKIYQASLEKDNDNYIVNFAYGRRGNTLKTGTKTQQAVPFEKAKKIFNKLVNDKMAKGYLPSENTTEYTHDNNQRNTGIHCQLLNPIDSSGLQKLLKTDDWWAQEKMDGKRLLLQNTTDLIAINRRGLSVGAPKTVLDSAKAANKPFLIDGEVIDDVFYVFDILSIDDRDLRGQSYASRIAALDNLTFGSAIRYVPTAKTTVEKKALFEKLQNCNAEGIVLKDHTTTYTSGRPNSGGNQLKFKFYETASVLVSKQNDKRSVAISVYENGKEIAIGNVTIPVNKEIPKLNDCIEVRYLYAYKGGSLYQPTYLMIRTDISPKECSIKQLKYKSSIK